MCCLDPQISLWCRRRDLQTEMPNAAIALSELHIQLEDRALSQCPSNQGRVRMPLLKQDDEFNDGAEHMETHAPMAVDSDCGEVAKVLYDIDTAPSGVSVISWAVSREPMGQTGLLFKCTGVSDEAVWKELVERCIPKQDQLDASRTCSVP